MPNDPEKNKSGVNFYSDGEQAVDTTILAALTAGWDNESDSEDCLMPNISGEYQQAVMEELLMQVPKELVSKELKQQIDFVVEKQRQRILSRHPDERSRERINRNFDWTAKYYEGHLLVRLERADDVISPEAIKGVEIAKKYYGEGVNFYFSTCIDGRLPGGIFFIPAPHFIGALRVPAGNLTGFLEGQNNNIVIDRSARVVQQLMQLLRLKARDKNGNIGKIYYGVDSHEECAAEFENHTKKGHPEEDGGLLRNVMRKSVFAQALQQLRAEMMAEGEDVAEIVPIQFSTNPENGGVSFGLETCVDDERVAEKGFTHEILNELSQEGKILRSLDMLQEPEIVAAISEAIEASSANYRSDWRNSTLNAWTAVEVLYANGEGLVFQEIYKRIIAVYEQAGWIIDGEDNVLEKKIATSTIDHKSKVFMQNLVNRFAQAGIDPHAWNYKYHTEGLIAIIEQGYAPYNGQFDAFAINAGERENLIEHINLAISLIRKVRAHGTSKDPFEGEFFKTQKEFINAPILVANKGIMRARSEETWKALNNLDLSVFTEINWDDQTVWNWTEADIQRLILKAARGSKSKAEIEDVLLFVDVVYELFDKVRIMVNDEGTRRMILHGSLVVKTAVLDVNRKTRLLIPFVF